MVHVRVRVFPDTAMAMSAVGANGAKSNVNFPPLASSARAIGSIVLPLRLMTRSEIVFFDPAASMTPMVTRVHCASLYDGVGAG